MRFRFCALSCFSSASEYAIDRPTHDGDNYQQLRVFSYNELKTATEGFAGLNKIGEGGFGSVYKGRLKDGTLVAVKVLSVELESMRGEREFVSELTALSNIKHENLVTLRGCCINGDSRFLVYDHMENNSVAHTLLGCEQNRSKFSWEARRNVSLGVARALVYLHEEVDPHIVHRDIKAANILLDGNLTPKVADFGLSRLLRQDKSYISTRVAGTLGYLAPEYAITGRLTRKSDVYSFGVLLLEMITGHPVAVFDLEPGEGYLVQKTWEAYKADSLEELVDPVLEKNYSEEEAIRFLQVGLLCVQEAARLRPQMSTAIKMLTNEINMEDIQISHPGLVTDFMAIKLGQKEPSDSSKGTSVASSHSAHSTYIFE